MREGGTKVEGADPGGGTRGSAATPGAAQQAPERPAPRQPRGGPARGAAPSAFGARYSSRPFSASLSAPLPQQTLKSLGASSMRVSGLPPSSLPRLLGESRAALGVSRPDSLQCAGESGVISGISGSVSSPES